MQDPGISVGMGQGGEVPDAPPHNNPIGWPITAGRTGYAGDIVNLLLLLL
jgi:hypothetical protein